MRHILPSRSFRSTVAPGTLAGIKQSGFKSISNRIPRASAREGLVGVGETKGGVSSLVRATFTLLKSGSINEGFNISMDESCFSVPTRVRRGTAKDIEVHKENGRYKPGDGEGCRVTPWGTSNTYGSPAPSVWLSSNTSVKGGSYQTANRPDTAPVGGTLKARSREDGDRKSVV